MFSVTVRFFPEAMRGSFLIFVHQTASQRLVELSPISDRSTNCWSRRVMPCREQKSTTRSHEIWSGLEEEPAKGFEPLTYGLRSSCLLCAHMQDLAWCPSSPVFPSFSLRRNAPFCTCLLVRMLVNLSRSADLIFLPQCISKSSN
jgi:hypothetical protein